MMSWTPSPPPDRRPTAGVNCCVAQCVSSGTGGTSRSSSNGSAASRRAPHPRPALRRDVAHRRRRRRAWPSCCSMPPARNDCRCCSSPHCTLVVLGNPTHRPRRVVPEHHRRTPVHPTDTERSAAALRAFCSDHAGRVGRGLIATRSTQTNEVGRCARCSCLSSDCSTARAGPIAHVDVGTSAGPLRCCGRSSRYRYSPGGERRRPSSVDARVRDARRRAGTGDDARRRRLGRPRPRRRSTPPTTTRPAGWRHACGPISTTASEPPRSPRASPVASRPRFGGATPSTTSPVARRRRADRTGIRW